MSFDLYIVCIYVVPDVFLVLYLSFQYQSNEYTRSNLVNLLIVLPCNDDDDDDDLPINTS
jgi:hypothetical protein